MFHYENLQLYLRLGLKLKKIYRVLEFNQSQWLQPYIEFNTHEIIEAEKNGDKDGKALYKLMNGIQQNDGKLEKQNRCKTRKKKDYLKRTSKLSYMSHKIFDNNLVVIPKSKVVLKLNKPAYIGMCILKLSKILMYEFHYDYIKNKYRNK